ncbi:NAD(P)H-nitrite reductase large subunit [Paenibacillus anaericanus]|uniref:nitrite reductase n=1 Tax=Paenibacillus anaericanus TaxID=170367 RepID=UPI0027845C4C|nr:nitrite reductase [Paenibacillus anaericanus]MDQ0088997.1 NAD(P)H-nitrite reductase large subunit [Paenibacillus anaericanus]
MGEITKIAVAPPIQVGGSLFTPEQLATIGAALGTNVKIEMTSFKQLYLEVPLDQQELITAQLKRSGLEVYPVGFVTKSLIACNFCKGAEEAGLEVAQRLNQSIAGIETPMPLKIGYAGCALGTSEPLLKDISVVKMRNTYEVYVGGEPKGLKTSIAQSLVSGLTEDQLVPIVTTLINYYKANAKGKEKFKKFIDRVTLEQLQQHVAGL